MNSSASLFELIAQGAPQGGNFLMQVLPFILIMVAMWFLLIQPQRKRQKEHQKMISELKVGDKVITSGGICGTITLVRKDRVQLKVDDATRIDVIKAFIQSRETE